MTKIYHNIIRDCLKELSDKAYQERVWTGSSPSEMSSFEEAFEQLYGGTGLDSAYGKGEQIYGEPIDSLLKNFETMLQNTPHKGPASKLIEDEKMILVRKMAAHILSLIEQQDREKQPA
jgi:hypothetical protein